MADVSIGRKTNGRYQVRWREQGVRRGRTFDRHRDADRFATTVRRRLQAGGVVELDDDNPITVAELVEDWWRRHARTHLAPNTRLVYGTVWDKHALPSLGEMPVRKVRTSTIDNLKVDLLARGVGAETVRKVLTMLQSVFHLAVRDDLLDTNPVTEVRRPAAPRRRGLAIWPSTVEAIRRGLSQRDATLVSVLAYAGLRPEEALALEWRDVGDRHLRVERALALGEIREDDMVKRHDRRVRLLEPLAEDLAAWRTAGGATRLHGLIFPRRDGEPWRDHDYRNWRKRKYRPAAAAAGLEGSRPYDLRGSFASLLIQEGRNVVYVAGQLGHTAETCLRHYARLFDEAPEAPVSAEQAIAAARRDAAQETLAI